MNIFNTMWLQYVIGLREPVTQLRLALRGYIFGFSDDRLLEYIAVCLKNRSRHIYPQHILCVYHIDRYLKV